MKKKTVILYITILGWLVQSNAAFSQTAQKEKAEPIHENIVFNHVAFFVRDMQKSVAFYKNIIGLDTIPVPPHGNTIVTWFKMNGNLQLHLVEGLKDSSRIPFNHIAFSVPSIDVFILKLNKANISFFGAKGKGTIDLRGDGVHQIYFRDPDGYEIEVNDMK